MDDSPSSTTSVNAKTRSTPSFSRKRASLSKKKKSVGDQSMEDCVCSPTAAPATKFPTRTLPSSIGNATNVVHVAGIPVEFPYLPYGTQLAFMNRVISTLDRSAREGHCHALLESPTGTGKSLSLLCSVLAWKQNQKQKNLNGMLAANSEAVRDPINCGGGFIPETQQPGNLGTPTEVNPSKKEKRRAAPTIFYASRTHAQISQVIREYKKTTYRVTMAVLGSRRHYCTNPYVQGGDNVDEQCKLLLKNKEDTCPNFKNANKVMAHHSLQKGGCHEVHDIEDLVKIGRMVKGCSYFAARTMALDAELVFCPYNYVINPIIRDAMEVDISRSVIIFDEAHNIEDVARDAGSADIGEEALLQLENELVKLAQNDPIAYQPLFEMTQDILSWIGRKLSTLIKQEFQHYCSCWTGDKALNELQDANITHQNFTILYECAKRKAIKAASEVESSSSHWSGIAANALENSSEVESVAEHLSGMAANTLEGLFSSLNYFFSGNGINTSNYELTLQRFVTEEGRWANVLSLWCLNPSVVFKSIAEVSQSVILTSGPHVIDVNSQVWIAAIANGPGDYPLNASYRTADALNFQDAIGKSLEEIFKVVPGGCLVFFPSYKLMDKMSKRWKVTGQWAQLNVKKTVFVEPRRSSQGTFDDVLRKYYDSVHKGMKSRAKRLGIKTGNTVKSSKDAKKEGAAFLAVCRGKVSEGMDFSNDNARAVVMIGIPFPNICPEKKFNDTYVQSKNLVSGNEWYCQQAFRAVNQAIGRCIRHRFDYGAVILLDERFHKERNRAYISKWLRKSIKLYSCFNESLESLKSFFRDVKDDVGTKMNPNEAHNEDFKNSKVTKYGCHQPKEPQEKTLRCNDEATGLNHLLTPVSRCDSTSGQVKCDVITVKTVKASVASGYVDLDNKDVSSVAPEYIDLENESERDLRWSEVPDDLDLTIVKETPSMDLQSPDATPDSAEGDFTFVQQSASFLHSTKDPYSAICSVLDTPRNDLGSEYDSTAANDQESPWSVNSKVRKRKAPSLSSVSCIPEFRTPAQVSERFSSLTSPLAGADDYPSPVTAFKPLQTGFGELPLSYGTNVDRSQVFCSNCQSPLGRFEEELSVSGSIISTSKVHLLSLRRKDSGACALDPLSVDVLLTDKSSVDERLFRVYQRHDSGQGIWCSEDGCVYNSIFCPFCDNQDTCLGVHIVATDGSNINFQNKIMLYVDCLVIKNAGAQTKSSDFPEDQGLRCSKNSTPIDLDCFAYAAPVDGLGSWRNFKSRVPK